MKSFVQDFTKRQYMVTPDYEFFHYSDKSTTEIELHNHDFYEVFCLISGNVTYVTEGRSYELKSGDILLIDNKDLHKPFVRPGEPYERIVIWIDPVYLKKESVGLSDLRTCFESDKLRESHLLSSSESAMHLIWSKIWDFERVCNSISFGSDILKRLYLIELIVYINKAFIESSNDETGNPRMSHDEKINEIIEYAAANLSEDLTLDHISSRFYISKYHLARLFKKYTGFTFHRYVLEKRLMRARSLLKEGKSVSETALESGFNDYSNFIRIFKKYFNIPPKKYYRQNVQKNT